MALIHGCGGKTEPANEDEIVIKFLTMQLRPKFDDYFLPLFAEFEAAHPGVKIQWLDYPYQNYETKLMTSFISGDAPDVLNLPSDSVMDAADTGYILELTDRLSPGVRDSYVPDLFESGVRNGKAWSLPWYASSAVSFYNKKIFQEAGIPFDEPPKYLEDLPEICRTIKEKTGKFGAFPIYTEAGSLNQMLRDAGVQVLNEDQTEATFYTPRGVEVLKYWTDLYRENLVPSEALTATHRRPIEQYKTGQLAILTTGPNFIGQVESDAPDVYKETTVGTIMKWRGSEKYNIALHSICVSSQSENPDVAVKFAEFITNGPNQLAFCKLVTILPSVTSALDDPYFTDTDDSLVGRARKVSAFQTRNGYVIPPLPEARKMNEVIDDITEEVGLGRMEADEGLKLAEERWNAILEK